MAKNRISTFSVLGFLAEFLQFLQFVHNTHSLSEILDPLVKSQSFTGPVLLLTRPSLLSSVFLALFAHRKLSLSRLCRHCLLLLLSAAASTALPPFCHNHSSIVQNSGLRSSACYHPILLLVGRIFMKTWRRLLFSGDCRRRVM